MPQQYVGVSMDQEALATQVKELQRTDTHAREQWAVFADTAGGGKRDPSKHSAEFLSGFLDQLNSGLQMPASTPPVDTAEELATVCGAVKIMQKRSTGFKTAWKLYCEDYGGGTFDPAKHEMNFLVEFMDFLSSAAYGGGRAAAGNNGTWGGTTWPAEPPAKRMRPGAAAAAATQPARAGVPAGGMPQAGQWAQQAGGRLVAGSKEYYVAQVKHYQKLGEQQNTHWGAYADQFLNGVRDPNRHEGAVLKEFCDNHGVPPPPEDWGVTSGAPPAGVQAPIVMDSYKEQLVQRIKAYQKASKEQGETWRQFCGGTYDPARHESPKLQEFITMYSVP
mmetsp:Transcript_14419/g.21834  ORF Transcript_14419/g.21834 Transcript_14419/m.21834 type:complete len:334 (-) Transcript_14419:127-1128(-)